MRGRCKRLRRRLGPEVSPFADVSNLTDLDTMFATIKREFGHLDGVLINVGYSVFLPLEEVTEQNFDKVGDLLYGMVLVLGLSCGQLMLSP